MTKELTAAHLRELGDLLAGVSSEERERMYVKAADYVRRHSAYIVSADVEKVVDMFREVYPNRPVPNLAFPELVSSGGGGLNKQSTSPYVLDYYNVAALASTAAVVIFIAYFVRNSLVNWQRTMLNRLNACVDEYMKGNNINVESMIRKSTDIFGLLSTELERLDTLFSNPAERANVADIAGALESFMNPRRGLPMQEGVNTAVISVRYVIDRVKKLSKIADTFDELSHANRMIAKERIDKLVLPSSAEQLDRTVAAAQNLYHAMRRAHETALSILKHIPDDEAYRLQKSQAKTQIDQIFADVAGLERLLNRPDGSSAVMATGRIVDFYAVHVVVGEIQQNVNNYNDKLERLDLFVQFRLGVLNKALAALTQEMEGRSCNTLLSELTKAIDGVTNMVAIIRPYFNGMHAHIEAVDRLAHKLKNVGLADAKNHMRAMDLGEPENPKASQCIDKLDTALIEIRRAARLILRKIPTSDATKGCVELINKHLSDLDKVRTDLTKYTLQYSTDNSGLIENISKILNSG